jgi:hypothetical protein
MEQSPEADGRCRALFGDFCSRTEVGQTPTLCPCWTPCALGDQQRALSAALTLNWLVCALRGSADS